MTPTIKKNTDTRTLNGTNIGDAAVIVLSDGSQQSATLTAVSQDAAVFQWRVGPKPTDLRTRRIARPDWPKQVKGLFAPGASFMVL